MILGIFLGAFCMFAILSEARRKFKSKEKSLEEMRLQAEIRRDEIASTRAELDKQHTSLKADREEFDRRKVAYDELREEAIILKRDLQNIDVNLHKYQLDGQLRDEREAETTSRVAEIGKRYLSDNVKWIIKSVGGNNYASCRKRLQTVVDRCRGIGFEISEDEESVYFGDLKAEFEKAVRANLDREEQSRIKAQIREEQQLEEEIDRELKQLERERKAIATALEKALEDSEDEHSEEVERLRARLAEAEQKSERTKSRAQLTKSGHVYVISNEGSFGKGVFKVGVSRRLDPFIRVRELGNASVPFPFDVHMMISSNDAPTLENALHRTLHACRVNKANPRKEFFRSTVEEIRIAVEKYHGQVEYTVDAEAIEYRESLSMSEEETEMVDKIFEEQGGQFTL